jgi:hypothetical protein
MKKTVYGIRYDTSKSRCLSQMQGTADKMTWFNVLLYLTPHGNYFLHGRGGPLTRWGQSEGMYSWTDGEDIIPLTEKYALKFMDLCFK